MAMQNDKKKITYSWKPYLVLLILNIYTFSLLHAAEKPILRIKTERESVWVGQKASFYIELFSPAFFSGTPKFALPTVSGVLLMKVAGRPRSTPAGASRK